MASVQVRRELGREVLQTAHARLARAYGVALVHSADRLGPVSQTIYVLLHAGSAQEGADAAFRALADRFWDWSEVRRAGFRAVLDATGMLDPTGSKARMVLRALATIEGTLSNGPRLSLDCLDAMDDATAIAALRTIGGMSTAMAAEVLLLSSLRRRILPATPWRVRVAERLGAIGRGIGPDMAHDTLAEIVPAEWTAGTCEQDHFATRALALRCCLPHGPRCFVCPLADLCSYRREALGSDRDRPREP